MIKGKSAVQKFVFEFGGHSSGSVVQIIQHGIVLCCGAKVVCYAKCVRIWKIFPKFAGIRRKWCSVNYKGVGEKKFFLCHRCITGIVESECCKEPGTRIWKTFLTFAEIREKKLTQEDKQEAPKDEGNRLTHSSGVTNRTQC